MKLKRLTLDNYGLYRGTVSFDLEPRTMGGKDRPVILFGGQNGAGKTTVFDAFRVVLYGKAALGARVPEAEYKEFLRKRVHRSADELLQQRSAYIELEFEHVPLGTPVNYVVRRAWELGNGKSVVEKLFISQDGVPLQSVSTDYWQGFVEEIIPQRLSSLFFFDGEKIKSIAEDGVENLALAESIKTLLGLDVVDRLHADLAIYKAREVLKIGSKGQQAELGGLEGQIEDARRRIENVVQELAANRSQLDGLSNEIGKAEARLKQEGYVFAQERDQLVSRKAQVENELDMVRQAIRAEYEGLYPFSLCPTLNGMLRQQLLAERQQHKALLIGEDLKALEGQLAYALDELGKGADVADAVCAVVSRVIRERLDSLAPPTDYVELHSVSSQDAAQLMAWLDEAENRAGQRVDKLQLKREELTRVLQEVHVALERAPSDVVLEPLVEELNRLNSQRGALLQRRQAFETEKGAAEQARMDAERRFEKICARVAARDDAGERVKYVEQVQQALADYSKRLTRAKIEELRIRARDCFNSLSRKGDLIEDMDIDPATFSVVLRDRFGNILPKEDLSAGEKQMYAVAMLWGLSLTSGRALPVIIDTPLGRLDSEHRRSLVSRYFPNAAEQVIVLSTDTEIDKQWYAELQPWVSHSYMLANKTDENRTIVEEGYFWRGGE